MKRFFRGGLISLFILLFLFGSITIQTVIQTQTNGRLINYVGIVRGASQRLIKLELSGQPDDDMIAYLDSILLNYRAERPHMVFLHLTIRPIRGIWQSWS